MVIAKFFGNSFGPGYWLMLSDKGLGGRITVGCLCERLLWGHLGPINQHQYMY